MTFLTTFIPIIKLYNPIIKLFSILGENIQENLGVSHFLRYFYKMYLFSNCFKKFTIVYLNSIEKELYFGIQIYTV